MKSRVRSVPCTLLLLYIIAVPLFLTDQTVFALDILVTSADNSGAGTLRDAIDTINSGTDVQNKITFAFNITTIHLLTPLPALINPVIIDGFETIMVNCEALSPVDNPEQFSAAISVTIDGSNMTPNEGAFTDGLLLCVGEVTIRGLRIQNIRSGTSNSASNRASGIRVQTADPVTIECCEIAAINGSIWQDATQSGDVVGIQGEENVIIHNCYVHDLSSGPLQLTAATTNGLAGKVKGIAHFKQVSDCFVTDLESGSIFSTENQIITVDVEIGMVAGITTKPLASVPCLSRQNCPCEACETIDCQGSDTTCIQHCLVTCCQTGSISLSTEGDIEIGSCIGIEVDSAITLLLEDCCICDLSAGSANVSLSDGEFVMNNVIGILCTELTSACIQRNTVNKIQQGSAYIDGSNSIGLIGTITGIFVQAIQATVINNQVDTVQWGTATLKGICMQLFDDPLQSDSGEVIQLCQNGLINQIDFSLLSACSSGLVVASTEPTVCDNSVHTITGGKRIDEGVNNQIFSFSSLGILVTSNPDEGSQQLLKVPLIANNNTVQNIVGPTLVARTNTSLMRALSPSKGMYLISFLTATPLIFACGNTIETVCEGTITAVPGAQAGYSFLVPFKPVNSPLLFVPQETAGILFRSVQIPLLPTQTGQIIAEDNTIRTIVGGTIQNGTLQTGTLAVGLSFNPQFLTPPQGKGHTMRSKTCVNKACPDGTVDVSLVRRNTIYNIWAGSNNHAYGILINNTSRIINSIDDSKNGTNGTPTVIPFSIDDNIIKNINGFGSPEPFTLSLENSIACIGTIAGLPSESAYLPFPYEPTSGIYTLFGSCSTISFNSISRIKEKNAQARGITTHASSDMCLNNNSISKITGYGIFVGGATAYADFINDAFGIIDTQEFKTLFASVRNKIHTNSIFDTSNDGIKLGVIDWNNYFETSQANCGSNLTIIPVRNVKQNTKTVPEDSVTLVGNHGQVAPTIEKVSVNPETITIDIRFNDPSHIFTNFIIQFFVNSSNSIPHGEHPISDFNDPTFVFTTNINGNAVKRFTFVPLHPVTKTDIISAHVTLAEQQQAFVNPEDKGDTSEFAQQQKQINPYPLACHAQQKPHTMLGLLCQ